MKKFFTLLMTAIFAFLVCGCFSSESTKAENIAEEKIDPVEEKLKTMTLEEKIGQMMLIGIQEKNFDENASYMLNVYHVGGIILYDRNMDTKEQVKKLTDDLQANSKIPLFIALDEEGGRVSRMKHAIAPPPSQELIGRSGDFNLAKTHAVDTAKKLKEIGVNINFAPVADVGNYERSFGTDANMVANFVSQAAKGYESENVFYCLKHFPGIGKATIDPHKDISEVEVSKEILEAEDLPPFKKIISEQDNSKFMVMLGHLKYLALDKENSASLSHEIVTNLLRKELNFQGVIITDDLEMGAISKYKTSGEIGIQAVKAGADILLICHNYETQKKVCDAILKKVQSGEISEDRINESVRRILKMKLAL